MGFTLRIWFSGLCHFVENRDPNAWCRMCVVLPRASGRLDAKDHVGRITYVEHEIVHGQRRIKPDEKGEIVRLDGHRIAFRLVFDKDLQQEFQNVVQEESGPPPPEVVRFEQIAGIYADENPEIVYEDPPDTVLAQVLLEQELVQRHYDISVVKRWELPPRLADVWEREIVWLADPVFVEFSNVARAQMLVSTLDYRNTIIKEVTLQSDRTGVAEILILNECQRQVCPGEFRRDGENGLVLMQIDEDFKFHYDLLHHSSLESIESHPAIITLRSQQESLVVPVPETRLLEIRLPPHLAGILDTLGLPRRVIVRREDVESAAALANFCEAELANFSTSFEFLLDWFGGGVGTGCDCLGCKGRARFIRLDHFLPYFLTESSPTEAEEVSREAQSESGETTPAAPPLSTAATTPPRATGKPAHRSPAGRTRRS